AALVVAGAYFLGSIPTGLLIGKRMGVDVRTQGSGNIGATNVARTVGKKVGVLVLLLDLLKGAIPIALYTALDLGGRIDLGAPLDPYLFTAVGLAPIVGHCFPIWLRFRGGKGVATALGVFLMADPIALSVGAALFAALYAAFRIVSIGSMAASIAIPIACVLLGRPLPVVLLAAAAAAIVIGKHHGNIRRLLRRSELKV
ncbi:MAG TPA: glycerol-3-phosphate 1-O-acyltransferase PlsY, partial [Kofleriaceae bacterium]